MIGRKVLTVIVFALVSGIVGITNTPIGIAMFTVTVTLPIILFIRDILDDVVSDLKKRLDVQDDVLDGFPPKSSKHSVVHKVPRY